MLALGPTMIVLLFFVAFILWIKFMTKDSHEIRVIKEEQLYNRYLEELKERRQIETKTEYPQRDPVSKEHRYVTRSTDSTHTINNSDDTRRDSGIV